MDRLRALETFIAVADGGGFAAAGRSLGMSPPSVTRLVSEFEGEIGATLFHRTTRQVTLTEAGETMLVEAKRILSAYDSAVDVARGAFAAPKGLLRVTAPNLFGCFYVTPLLRAYLDRYPDASVEAVYLDRVVNIVEEGFDLAVRIGDLPDSTLMATRVGAVRRVVCGAPGYFGRRGAPLAPEELSEHDVINARAVTPTPTWRFAGGRSVEVRPRLTVSSVSAAIDGAKEGWGLTRVLSYQIASELDAGALKTVLSEFEPEPLPVHVLHAGGVRPPAKVCAFLALARETLRANPHLN
ncbi:MAG: LysR family transcriptional regulator [Alphaproteobacteria bacterium]|nr:LysR family transcriptional regulator [Alphaproteobacteria bacterium]